MDGLIQLAHFTDEEIGGDKPIYIPSLEERENLVSHSSKLHCTRWYCPDKFHATLKVGRGESFKKSRSWILC